MSSVAVAASVLLGMAFLIAGGSKVAAGPAWPDQARGLKTPAFVIPILPWVEIGLGALLIVQVVPLAASMASLVLLVGFTAAIIVRLAKGEHPPCACFGAWSAKPIGPGNIVRNIALMLLAIAVLVASIS